MRRPWLPILLSAVSACSLAPRYRKPPVESPPATFKEDSGEWQAVKPADIDSRGRWWEMFSDPRLNALEERVTASNQNIKAALARLEQARAATRIARAAHLPALTAGASATRSRTSVNSPSYSGTRSPIANDFVLDADLSYELDVWGRVRNTVSAARATAQASAADLATVDLSTHAELASDYFMLAGLDSQVLLVDKTVADYEQSLQLTRHLYDGGAATLADLDQARSQLESARTQATDFRLRRAQTEHAIAVLVAESPSTFRLDPHPLQLDRVPPAIDPGLPSQLLERRPDVAAAERRVSAANAEIGVARAAYFPVFSLAGEAGFESTKTSNWISAPSRFWSSGPSALLTVFDAGLHGAQTARARAAYDEEVASYRNTVLVAYQEVEDNLAALHALEAESVSQAAAVAATTGALTQSQYQFQGGVVTFLQVAVTENAALSAQLAATDIQVRRLTAIVLLVKALGGAWNVPTAPR
ncbi:MAG TPA: efflux transporter outer membrane subunit [Steroidobacteraceae bacterium]|nr:efflux transporter outer membrane subunit [Steroidobacteraceae bacterium]